MSAVYTFTLSQLTGPPQRAGCDVAECDWSGRHYRAEAGNGATMKLARMLISAGAPDGAWQAVRARRARVDISGPSLYRLASMTVRQDRDGNRSERFVRWRPAPGVTVPASLQDALRADTGAGKNGVSSAGRAGQGVEEEEPLAA